MRGDRIKLLRDKLHLTQKDLADLMGISDKQLWRYENNKSEPTADQLGRLAEALQTTTDYLIGLSNQSNPSLDESDLSPDERALIFALRQGAIVESLERFTKITKRDDQPTIPDHPALDG